MTIKSYFKALTKKQWFQNVAAKFAAAYMKVVFKTIRWEYKGSHRLEKYTSNKRPLIACFWHNRLGMMRFAWKSEIPFHMLISTHADGKIIANTIKQLGVNTIEGSSSKGGTEATRKILKTLKKGECVGVTPDGPRGPRYTVNPGLVQLAQLANADLLPVSYSITNRIIWKSWDGMAFPLPFGRGIFIYGDPIPANRDCEAQDLADLLRKRLIETSNESDILIGNSIIPEASKKAASAK